MAIIKSKKNLPGVSVKHSKNTAEQQTRQIPLPSKVMIPMIQHMGVACEPIVAIGDKVSVGQKIGESSEFLCVPIHASCSGTITEIISYHTVSGASCKACVIETDGMQTLFEGCKKPTVSNRDELVAAIKESGLVGLGGAGFPTFVKLGYKDIDRVTKLVINAAECEPYITADYREVIENLDGVVEGIRAVKKHLGIDEVFIGVEDNKPAAITLLNDAFSSEENVKVVRLKTLYPQGAEKSIIYATTGVEVDEGKLPADCGVIVLNISTVGFIGDYLKTGIPLVKRRLTVDGDIVTHPENLFVPIGTPIGELLECCKIKREDCGKVLMGGPMMGIPVLDFDAPIVKNNNAVIVVSHGGCEPMKTTACIRCGKCIRICPMNLMPAKLERASDLKDIEMLQKLHLSLCINCGCCTYICPAKRHLAQKNQLSKIFVKNKTKERHTNE